MKRRTSSSGSPFETTIGFSRAMRVGDRILVSGTGPVDADGSTTPGDAAAQAERILAVIVAAIEELGGSAADVVRTRMYLTDAADADAVGAVHGRWFGTVRPAATMVVVAALLRPEWRVEIEAEAVLGGPGMTQFDLTDDQREIQELARRFTADRIAPHAAEWDANHIFPRDTIRQAAELGFAAIYVSEESGGIALGRLEAALIMEAMAYGCPSTSAFISIHNMASWMIDRFGSAAVKAKYLPGLVTMDQLASYCLTEPSSGSDAAALKTRAVRDGGDYIVTGSKQFISGGGENEVYVTMVRTGEDGPRGISALVIEKDLPGVSFGANERKLGWHSQPTAQVILDAVRVPAENLVGGEGEGFRIAMMGLDGGRINIGACSLGGAQRCLDESIGYTRDRQQFGRPLADFQNTQFTLADMATELEAARALLLVAAAKVTADAPDKTRFAAMAKRLATDTGSAVVDRALQLHGGYGYLMDYPIERFWRDLRVHSILEGTNQVMRMIVGRELTQA